MNEKFKYQKELSQYPNCPPEEYEELEMEAIRWVKKGDLPNSFNPLNYKKEPPRKFDRLDDDCKSFGLSMYDSIESGLSNYKAMFNQKRGRPRQDFIDRVGDAMAIMTLTKGLGCMGKPNTNTGHFTFHEYVDTNLEHHIKEIIDIFDENGNFKQ